MCHILCHICQNFGVVYSGFMCRPHTNAHILTWLLSGTIKQPKDVGNSSRDKHSATGAHSQALPQF